MSFYSCFCHYLAPSRSYFPTYIYIFEKESAPSTYCVSICIFQTYLIFIRPRFNAFRSLATKWIYLWASHYHNRSILSYYNWCWFNRFIMDKFGDVCKINANLLLHVLQILLRIHTYSNKEEKDANSIQCSQAVTHPSTNRTQHCLTSVIGRELVCSMWYGRWREVRRSVKYIKVHISIRHEN